MKMIFNLPGDLAAALVRCVPARQRSRYVAEAVVARLAQHDRRLREAAAMANACPELRALEGEWDALPDVERELGIENGLAFHEPEASSDQAR